MSLDPLLPVNKLGPPVVITWNCSFNHFIFIHHLMTNYKLIQACGMLPPSGRPLNYNWQSMCICSRFNVYTCVCVPPGQVLVLVEVLEEGGLTDELLLLTHLLTGATRLGQFDLQSAERRPHHLAVAEVLTTQRDGNTVMLLKNRSSYKQTWFLWVKPFIWYDTDD